ncbi:MAG: response regulator [Desulfobacteraceae bacterium]|jgi:two-component system chemotaxis response regulator CheY
MKLLIVDDDPVSRILMTKYYCEFGDCVVSISGKEALIEFEYACDKGAPFDLISLDINLSDMSGIDVLKTIRNIEKDKGVKKEKMVKVIMVTSHSDQGYVIGSVKAGCDNYIVKPFDRACVNEKLKSMGFSPVNK